MPSKLPPLIRRLSVLLLSPVMLVGEVEVEVEAEVEVEEGIAVRNA
jgi:hypothetical protein